MRELLEEEPGGRGVRIHVGGEEIAAAHLDRIEPELAGHPVHHGLHDERGHRVADRPVLRHRRLVLEDHAAAGVVVAEAVRARRRAQHLAALHHARARIHREGPDRRQVVEPHAEDGPVALHRHLRGDAVIARVDVGLERLDAVREELDRPAEHHRERARRDLVGIGVDLEPEGAADVLVDHPHAVLGDPQMAGEDVVEHVGRLARVVHGQGLVGRVVVRQHHPRLQADHRVPAGVEGLAVDRVRGLERGVHVAGLDPGLQHQVVAQLRMDDRRLRARARPPRPPPAAAAPTSRARARSRPPRARATPPPPRPPARPATPPCPARGDTAAPTSCPRSS